MFSKESIYPYNTGRNVAEWKLGVINWNHAHTRQQDKRIMVHSSFITSDTTDIIENQEEDSHDKNSDTNLPKGRKIITQGLDSQPPLSFDRETLDTRKRAGRRQVVIIVTTIPPLCQ